MKLKIRKAARLTATIPAPAGIDHRQDAMIPVAKHTTETIAEEITTALNRENTRMEVNAGKMIRLEISIVPIIRIPTTIVTAVSTAIIRLYNPVFMPVALAKDSSNVTAKIFGYSAIKSNSTTTESATERYTSDVSIARMLPNM